MSLLSDFLKETYKHPLFNMGLALSFWLWIGFSFHYFAVASEVREIKTDLGGVTATVKRSALETRVHSLESEIFQLERLVAEETARNIDYNRLARLRSELGTAERQLARIE